MAELIAQWLNEEVGLSKKVQNFEEDFASGYLFGELLYKFNQLSEFSNFSTKNATSHYVMNFEKLEPTLRSLNVQFNSKTVEKIMSRERGQALRLLYQLKMVLEKVYPPADISIVAKTGTFGDNQPAQRIAFTRPAYDEVTHNFFKQRVGKLNRAQKEIDLEAHLQKFDDEAKRQAAQAAHLDSLDKQEDARKKNEMRRIQINKLQRNAGFMEEWLAKGVEDWKQNMTIKREREAATLEFNFTQAEKYNQTAQQKLQEAQDEVVLGIENFERNLKAQGINTDVSQEDAHKVVEQTLRGNTWHGNATVTSNAGTAAEQTFAKTFDQKASTQKGNYTLTSTGLRHRSKKVVTESQRKEREKRRRRLINQQSNLLVNLELEARESHVTELMRRQSRQEKELDYEAWRTAQCKNIIVENRKLREVQYAERRKYDIELGLSKEQQLLQDMQNASLREIDQMTQRIGELKTYEKQHKLKQRTELCQGLMSAIFDIADDAFNHMQDLDSSEWDSRNWTNWLELFVHEQTITGTMAELLNSDIVQSKSQDCLDEAELRDYCENRNQWPATLVSENKLNLADVLNPKVETAAPAKAGGKGASKAVAQSEVVFDEAELEVTDKPANNYIFGDVIDQLIKLYYPPRPQLKHPPTPNWLALKVCLAGYPFSGKKTQAQLIKQKYGIDLIVMEDLINEALSFDGQTQFTPLSQPQKEEGSDYESLSEDEAFTSDLNEQMMALKNEINDQLLNGEEIRDETYIRLFVHKLRTLYEYKSPSQKRKEVKDKAERQVQINQRINQITEELANEELPKRTRKQLVDEQADLEIQLQDLDKLPTNGWVLVDFPSSYSQAKLLEEALSGYKPLEEMEPTDREIQTKSALLLVKPTAQEQNANSMISSGLDAVVWFDCSTQECLRRSDGRRIDLTDPTTRYHVFDQVPPCDQAPLCERLLPLSEVHNSVQGLPDRFVAFDQNTNSMQRWMQQFGDEQKDRVLITNINAEKTTDEVHSDISIVIDQVLQHRFEKYVELKTRLVSKIEEKEELRMLKAEEDDEMPMDSNRDGSKHSPRQSPTISTNKSKDMKVKRGSETAAPVSIPVLSPKVEGTIESTLRQPVFGRDNIEQDFRPTLIKLWQDLSNNYRQQMKSIFRNQRRFREQNFRHLAKTQQKFLEFLKRIDNKQELLDNFVREFNNFSDEFPDLREDGQTKDELHQRCDVLSDELWEVVEERKEQNIEERKRIMDSGDVENGLEFLTLSAQQLMQAELDKFRVTIQILHDYYFSLEEKPTHEITGPTTSELVFDENDIPQVEQLAENSDSSQINNYSYPRLEKLLQLALKQQVVPDVTAIQTQTDKAPKGGKAKPPAGKNAAAEQETIVEESTYVKEMKEAIKIEKSILRFRLVQIRNWTIQRLQKQRQTAIQMYKKFEDWITVAQKAEMDTIEEMCVVIKRAIEEEKKIQNELRIEQMNFTVDHQTLNYIDPPIPKLEALEAVRTDRFSIQMLNELVSEFESFSRSTGDLIQHRELINLIFNKLNNGRHFGGAETGFPEAWCTLGLEHINQMIRNIDSHNTGYVNWRTLATCFILLLSEVPSGQEIIRFQTSLSDKKVSLAQFTACHFWFDESEQSEDRPNANEFPRSKQIKQLLYRVHSRGKESMDVAEFSVCVGQLKHANQRGTFQDVLFANVKI